MSRSGMREHELRSRIAAMADTVEELFNSNRKACLRLIPRLLSQLRRQSTSPERAKDVRISVLRIQAIRALIRQELGSKRDAELVFQYAEDLKELGEWEAAIWIVWKGHTFGNFDTRRERVGTWMRWIALTVPQSNMPLYAPVLNLLAFEFYARTFRRDKAIRCLLRSIGPIPRRYVSKRLKYLIASFGSELQSVDEDMSVLVGQAVLESVENFTEEDRLSMLLHQYLMLEDEQMQVGEGGEIVRSVGAVAEERGFAVLRVQTLLDGVSKFNANATEHGFAAMIEKSQMFGRPRCAISTRSFYLALMLIPDYIHKWPAVRGTLQKCYRRMRRYRHEYFDVQIQLAAIGIALFPKHAKRVVRETLNVFSKQELATIGEEVVHLAMMIARGNCSVILDNGLELCINSALQYANRNFSGADKRQLELGLALSTVVQERRKARIQAQSVRGTHNLVVAKVRHDVKYYVTLLEDYIAEFKSGRDVQASNVLAAIEDIQGLFYQPSDSKSVDEFVKDVRRAVDSAGRISQQSRCKLFIDESLPSGRILEFREYEHLQSGVFNIILNAFQHSDQNSDIEISIAEQDHYIVLEITNRKHNHNKSSLNHDVSFRGKVVDFTSRGSGLAITRQLLQDNGADVVIVEGADTFTVTIKVLMCS